MKRFLAYLKYVILHKWYVWKAGLAIGAPIWRLIIHDWTKFLPSEWGPYSRNFYLENGESRPRKRSQDRTDEENKIYEEFQVAMHLHFKRNKHHWNYWIYYNKGIEEVEALEMPDKYIFEMVSDWMGAGKAKSGSWSDIFDWWKKNKDKMILGKETRRKVKTLITDMEKGRW